MTTEANDSTPGMAADAAPIPPPLARTPAMASLTQWEERGNGPSGPAIVSIAFSAGVIALGVLLLKNGVLAPHSLTELNDTSVRRSWAPFFDVSAVGTASVNAAQPATSLTPPAAAAAAPSSDAPPESAPESAPSPATRRATSAVEAPAPQHAPTGRTNSSAPARAERALAVPAGSDPYAHLEEGAASTPAVAPPTPAAPAAPSAPRIVAGKNTTAVPAAPAEPEPVPAPPDSTRPATTIAPQHGRSTWGGERTPSR